MTDQPASSGTAVPKSKNRGCYFYGCLTLSLVIVLGLLFAASGLYFAYRNVKTQVAELSDAAPLPVSVVDLPADKLLGVQARLARFEEDSRAGVPTPPLALDTQEINALIRHDARFAQVKNHISVELADDQLHANLSVPLDAFGQPGRYFNGAATIRLAQGEKGPSLFLERLEVKGKPVDNVVMEQLRTIDLLNQARLNSQNQEFFRLMEQVHLKGGKLIIFARSSTTL